MQVTWLSARCIQNKFLAIDQHHLAIGKLADADLGALQVGHDGDFAPHFFGGLPHKVGAVDVVLGFAVAEIQTNHRHTRQNHLLQQSGIARRRPERGNNFGGVAGH